MTATETTLKEGRIVAIAGPVVDVEFPPDGLPQINHALEFTITVDGVSTKVTAEVAQQIGDNRVRAISMKPTDGLARGTVVHNTGRGINVPVGDVTLGHVFNVIGEPLASPRHARLSNRWDIHPGTVVRLPEPKADARDRRKVLLTLTCTCRRQDRNLPGGAGVGKTVLITG